VGSPAVREFVTRWLLCGCCVFVGFRKHPTKFRHDTFGVVFSRVLVYYLGFLDFLWLVILFLGFKEREFFYFIFQDFILCLSFDE